MFNLSDNDDDFGNLGCFNSSTCSPSKVEGRRDLMLFLGRLSRSVILPYFLLSDDSSTSESSDSELESV